MFYIFKLTDDIGMSYIGYVKGRGKDFPFSENEAALTFRHRTDLFTKFYKDELIVEVLMCLTTKEAAIMMRRESIINHKTSEPNGYNRLCYWGIDIASKIYKEIYENGLDYDKACKKHGVSPVLVHDVLQYYERFTQIF